MAPGGREVGGGGGWWQAPKAGAEQELCQHDRLGVELGTQWVCGRDRYIKTNNAHTRVHMQTHTLTHRHARTHTHTHTHTHSLSFSLILFL